MMTREEIIGFMKEIGVLQEGHFRLTSGLHSNQYMQCARVFQRPKNAEKLIGLLKKQLPTDVDTVIAPAIGGICMGYEVARALDCNFIFAERQEGIMTLRRGFQVDANEKVLIAEDVVTTGGSVKEVMEIAKGVGCEVKGVVSLVDRSNGEVDFGVDFFSLLQVEIKAYKPEECPLCKQGLPINKPGSR